MPPRFYDLVDGESGRVLASDLTSGRTRARSMVCSPRPDQRCDLFPLKIRQTRLAEERAWPQPLYGDMVTQMMIIAITIIWMMVKPIDEDNGDNDDEEDDHSEQVIGPTASAGHYSVPRTSGEFSRDIISRSRSPR